MNNKANDAVQKKRVQTTAKELAVKAKQVADKVQHSVLKAADRNGDGQINAEDFGITKEAMLEKAQKLKNGAVQIGEKVSDAKADLDRRALRPVFADLIEEISVRDGREHIVRGGGDRVDHAALREHVAGENGKEGAAFAPRAGRVVDDEVHIQPVRDFQIAAVYGVGDNIAGFLCGEFIEEFAANEHVYVSPAKIRRFHLIDGGACFGFRFRIRRGIVLYGTFGRGRIDGGLRGIRTAGGEKQRREQKNGKEGISFLHGICPFFLENYGGYAHGS